MWRRQRFEGNPCRGHPAGRSTVNKARYLIGNLGKVDGQLVTVHFDFDLDRYRLGQVSTIVVKERRGFINSVRYRAHGLAHELVGLMPDCLDRFQENFAAIFAADLLEPLFTRAAACDLRAEISEGRFRKPDVVLDQPQHLRIRPPFVIDLDRPNLQSFFINIARHARAKASAAAANVDPMGAHCQEAEQFAIPKERGVDDHVIEVLPADLRMIDEKNISDVYIVQSIDLDAVLNRYAQVSEEDRQRAPVLRHRLPLVIDDADAVVLHLVDHHVVSRALEHSRHFIGGGLESAADNFYRNRIDGHSFASLGSFKQFISFKTFKPLKYSVALC